MKKILQDESYLKSLFSVLRNRYFLIFTCTCGKTGEREGGKERENKGMTTIDYIFLRLGLLIGASSAYMTVYAEVLHNSGYESYDGDAGYVGLATQVFALAAQLFVGVWISRTKAY